MPKTDNPRGRPFATGNDPRRVPQFVKGHSGPLLDLDRERKKLLLAGKLKDAEASQVINDLSAKIADVQERMKFQLVLLEKSYRAGCFTKLASQVLNLIQRLRQITQPSENTESGTVDVADLLPSPTRETFAQNSLTTPQPAQAPEPNAHALDEERKRQVAEEVQLELLKRQVALGGLRAFEAELPAQRDSETGKLTGIAIKKWGASKPRKEPFTMDLPDVVGMGIPEPPEPEYAPKTPILDSRAVNQRRQNERAKYGLNKFGAAQGTRQKRYGRFANQQTSGVLGTTDANGRVVDPTSVSYYLDITDFAL